MNSIRIKPFYNIINLLYAFMAPVVVWYEGLFTRRCDIFQRYTRGKYYIWESIHLHITLSPGTKFVSYTKNLWLATLEWKLLKIAVSKNCRFTFRPSLLYIWERGWLRFRNRRSTWIRPRDIWYFISPEGNTTFYFPAMGYILTNHRHCYKHVV